MKRREFIILGGIGATSASLLSACGHPEEKLIPALIPDDEFVPGIDYWKASTCGMCPAGCGIIVRTREHKANKIEGNPLHPVNRGALCARGQAGLEVLYNPDRIKGPMKRVGERGEGKWEEISWEEGIKTLADKLREIDPHDSTHQAQFVTGDREGVTAHVAGRLMQAHRQTFVAAPLSARIESGSVFADFLSEVDVLGEPIFDIANATYLVSFGARFLETWRSPVMYSQAYGEFRSSNRKARGRFIHVEPRMSLTAANADEWVPAAAGAEALVALAMIQVVVREGLNRAPLSAETVRSLEEFSPERVFPTTDVPAARIISLAREFAKAERPLAISDLQSPAGAAVHLLNAIVANVNKPGGVLLVDDHGKSNGPLEIPGNGLILPGESNEQVEKPNARESAERISRFFKAAQPSQPSYSLVMIHAFNPMFGKRGRGRYLAVPFIVSFSSFMDETSEWADLILPDHTYLERWDIHTSHGPDGRKVVSLTQPALEPQLDSRQTADVLLAVAREMGGAVAHALPYDTTKDIVEKSASDFFARDSREAGGLAWNELVEKGIAPAESPSDVKSQAAENEPVSLSASLMELVRLNASEGSLSPEYPLTLIVYEHATFGGGSAANLPSLQELPDPMTSVIWGSWVEINPTTAAAMGIADGDLVEVMTAGRSVRAPALIYPGIRPDCIAMPTGQGHSSYGRYARARGVDPGDLLVHSDQDRVRSRVIRVGKAKVIRFGTALMEHMESKR